MIELRIKEKDIRFQLPANWSEVTFEKFLLFQEAKDDADILAALSGLDVAIFRSAPAELSLVVTKVLAYLKELPDLVNMPVPKTIAGWKVPKSIHAECSFGQKLMVDDELRSIIREGKEPDFVNMAYMIVSIYMYKFITGKDLTDVAQVEETKNIVMGWPCLDVLRLSSFFLDNTINQKHSGQISYRQVRKPGSNRFLKLLPLWFQDWLSFKTISQYKRLPTVGESKT